MTTEEKFKVCQQMAQEIVGAYRKECPEGFDLKNTWVAAGVLVVGTAVTAGSQYMAGKKQEKAAKDAAGAMQNPAQLVPELIDPSKLQATATRDAFAGLRNAKGLNNRLNKLDYKQAVKFMNMIQPQFKSLQSQIGSNALSFAKGELPADVVGSITRAAAQQGQQLGFGSSGGAAGGMLRNLNLRNLGLTSLDLSKYGTQLGMQVNQSAKSLLPNLGSVRDWILNLPQQGQIAQFNANAQNQANQYNTGTANQAQQANAQGILQSGLTDAATTAGIGQTIGGAISGTGSLFQGSGGMGIGSIGSGIPKGTYPIQAGPGQGTSYVTQAQLTGQRLV